MNAWIPTLAAFVAMVTAGAVGMLLARRLPEAWLAEGSVKSLKAGMALVATMSSLLLGLMVNSARYNFSEAYSDVQKYAAALQMTDLELLSFGAPACPARLTLQDYGRRLIAETWSEDPGLSPAGGADPALKVLLRFDGALRALAPATDDEKQLRGSLLSLSQQLVEFRWKVSGVARTATPVAFIVVVICWFTLIFLYVGVFAPRNPLVMAGHVLAMAGISAAIFLVAEMGEPFAGPIRVPPGPVVRLLQRMAAEPCPAVPAPPAPARPG
ncbi:hypothetical protein V5F59_17350 [Xanthobacter autotrophicus DSM 431]|uniref:bestrophin-like domain n=1 Tax=Xanthobacter nonsaccharivorans TaxID=3119912 RepID=UPI0037274C25